MPEMTLDEYGNPVWNDTSLGSDTGPEVDPIAQALQAVAGIGTPGGAPLPTNPPEWSPGSSPQGGPPDPNAYLINPADEGRDFPSEAAIDLPQVGGYHPWATNLSGNEGALPMGDIASAASGPSDAYQQAHGLPVADQAAQALNAVSPPSTTTPQSSGKAGGAIPAPKLDAVGQANALVDQQQATAAEAMANQAIVANEAQRQLIDRRGQVLDEYAAKSAAADQSYQAARDAAQKASDQETAVWMQQMEAEAKKEPNPKRWFSNASTPSKILWLAGLAFGTKAAATAPGVKNVALQMMKETMEQDMQIQKEAAARRMGLLKIKGQQIEKRGERALANNADDHTIRMGQLMALGKASMERAGAPGSADDQSAFAAANTWFQEQKLATAGTRATQAYQTRERRLAEAHSSYQARLAREQQDKWKTIERNDQIVKDTLARLDKYNLADQALAVKYGPQAAENARAEKMANYVGFSPKASGIMVVNDGGTQDGKPYQRIGPDGKPIDASTLTVPAGERHKEFNDVSQAGQRVVADLDIIEKALADGSFTQKIMLGNDPRLMSAVSQLGYNEAKALDPGGRVTDADFANGIKSALGVEFDTVTGKIKTSVFVGQDDMLAGIRAIKDKTIARTTQALNATLDATEYPGARIDWRPAKLNADEKPSGPRSLAQSDASLGIDTSVGPVTSPKDLARRQEAEKAGQPALPPYRGNNAAYVRSAKDELTGRSVESVEKARTKMTQAVEGDTRAIYEVDQAAEKAKARAAEIEDAIKVALTRDIVGKNKAPTREDVTKLVDRKGLTKASTDAAYMDELMQYVEDKVRMRRGFSKEAPYDVVRKAPTP